MVCCTICPVPRHILHGSGMQQQNLESIFELIRSELIYVYYRSSLASFW